MSSIGIALILLACVFGAGVLGMFLQTVLPEHHMSDASKDIVKLVTGLLATLAALVLGLLVASAKNAFDTINEEFREGATKVILLDRTLAQYGPETKEVREMLRNTYNARIDQIFSGKRNGTAALSAVQGGNALEQLEQKIRALAPQTDAQRSYQSRAVDLCYAITQMRLTAIEHEYNTLPTPFIVVLVFWLAAMFTSFGLFAPRNAIAITVLLLGAVSLAGSMFLIEELNHPLDGYIVISRAPLDLAAARLGR